MRAFEEGLEIARQLLKDYGETPQGLRDLSVALNYAGDAAQAQGRQEAAVRAYEEGMETRRRLLEKYGETHQGLRDLSVSLNKVGEVAQAQGQQDKAAKAYAEGMEIRRRLLKEFGETPQAVLDLAIALEKVADTRHGVAAKSLYDEALMLARRLALVFQNDARGDAARERIQRREKKCAT